MIGFMSSSLRHLIRMIRTGLRQRRPHPGRCSRSPIALILLLTLNGCASLPAPTPPPVLAAEKPAELPAGATGPPQQAAPALIAAEREAARTGNLRLLSAVWAPDARIVDGRNTDDQADDYVWLGRDAILDRYVIAVFPVPPPPLDPSLLDSLRLSAGSEDRVVHAELGVDSWTLVQRDGRWWLYKLRYN
jgi:hypothetical protein